MLNFRERHSTSTHSYHHLVVHQRLARENDSTHSSLTNNCLNQPVQINSSLIIAKSINDKRLDPHSRVIPQLLAKAPISNTSPQPGQVFLHSFSRSPATTSERKRLNTSFYHEPCLKPPIQIIIPIILAKSITDQRLDPHSRVVPPHLLKAPISHTSPHYLGTGNYDQPAVLFHLNDPLEIFPVPEKTSTLITLISIYFNWISALAFD